MVKIIINLRIRVAFRRTVSWHSSVIVGIAHDPVKEKDHFDQQEWPAASYSAITTGPSRDSLALWVGVLEHLRAHGWEWETAPKQETRRRRHVRTRSGGGGVAGHPPAGPACLAGPSHYRGICKASPTGEGALKLGALLGSQGCPAISVVLLITDTSGEEHALCSQNCCGFPALPLPSR